jgi:hypothetical protein
VTTEPYEYTPHVTTEYTPNVAREMKLV